jgi:alkaline phosphatase D
VDFFLLDNRYYHSPNNRASGKRTLLGEEQVSWLIDALTASEASFKFIVVGGQFLNPLTYGENFSTFPEERSKILRLISRENISGIIFLTGDRHHTELSKLERENLYPLYDLTVSPLTSAPNPQHIEEHNFLRVPKTFVGERNFARLNVTGPGNNRLLKIAVFDKSGTELWTRAIKANNLK